MFPLSSIFLRHIGDGAHPGAARRPDRAEAWTQITNAFRPPTVFDLVGNEILDHINPLHAPQSDQAIAHVREAPNATEPSYLTTQRRRVRIVTARLALLRRPRRCRRPRTIYPYQHSWTPIPRRPRLRRIHLNNSVNPISGPKQPTSRGPHAGTS